jgi:predicted  nucleic acid-binding Zn-ribbon protein
MDSIRQFEERSFKEQLQSLDKLREENTSGLFEVIGMKNKRLTYQEARIEALEREVEKLNIEKLNLEYQLKQAQDAINK